MEEKKAQLFHDILCLDSKEETLELNEEDWQQWFISSGRISEKDFSRGDQREAKIEGLVAG